MKIIAIPNAHALAHVSRLLEISKVLRNQGHEIIFLGYGNYLQIAEKSGFVTEQLHYISLEQIIDAVRSQKLGQLYKQVDLEKIIDLEISYFKQVNPNLVLIDNRPTARTSADYCSIKTAAVLNVHMSQYRKLPFFSLGSYFEFLRLTDPLVTKIECLFYDKLVMKDLNKIRKEMGLKRYYGNQHEEGDLSLLADVPEFNPVNNLPQSVHFVGPLTWHNNLPEPQCMEQLDPGRKTIYFSLGSASLQEILKYLEPLTQENAQIVVAYGKFDEVVSTIQLPQHVYLEEYVNADKLLPHCDAVCCHGGNGTLYQALSYGLPIVAVASHAEQFIGAKRLQQLGLGLSLTLKDIDKFGFSCLFEAVRKVIKSQEMLENCKKFSMVLNNYNAAYDSAIKIESLVKD